MAKSKSTLGDQRLARPYGKLLDAMMSKMSVVLRKLGSTRTEEVIFGRFLSNPRVTPDSLVSQFWSTHARDWSSHHLLVIEDTTCASFGLLSGRQGLGYIGESAHKRGFYEHCALMVDADDLSCYGLGGVSVFTMDTPKELPRVLRHKHNWKVPFEQKNRYKWFDSAQKAISNCPGAMQYTIVGDRESDIYDLYVRYEVNGWNFLSRSKYDRRIAEGQSLQAHVKSWEVKHAYSLHLPMTDKRNAHEAQIELRFGSVHMLRPKTRPDKNLPNQLPVFIVDVQERDHTVIPGQKPVHWTLITSHEVTTVEQAMKVVNWYSQRWAIEQTFRTLKSEGLNLESSESRTFESLANLSTLALIAASSVMQLVNARDGTTQQDLRSTFESQEIECIIALNTQLEGKTEKLKNPHHKDSLAFAAWVIARLAGWSGYQNQRPPGPITMLYGFVRFYQIYHGFSLRL